MYHMHAKSEFSFFFLFHRVPGHSASSFIEHQVLNYSVQMLDRKLTTSPWRMWCSEISGAYPSFFFRSLYTEISARFTWELSVFFYWIPGHSVASFLSSIKCSTVQYRCWIGNRLYLLDLCGTWKSQVCLWFLVFCSPYTEISACFTWELSVFFFHQVPGHSRSGFIENQVLNCSV
jgi:hypothetical protein